MPAKLFPRERGQPNFPFFPSFYHDIIPLGIEILKKNCCSSFGCVGNVARSVERRALR